MSKTFGQLIDEYTANKDGKQPETIVLYRDRSDEPFMAITWSVADYDWQNIFTENINLRTQNTELKTAIKRSQDKLRQLEKSKTAVEKAIKLLTSTQAKGGKNDES